MLNLIESSSLTQLAQLDKNAGDLETKAGGCERIGSVLFLSLDSMTVTLDGSLGQYYKTFYLRNLRFFEIS